MGSSAPVPFSCAITPVWLSAILAYWFLAVNAKPAPLDYDTNVFFGHNFLASYWSVQQALATYWLDKGTNSTATSLTIDESYAAWD